MKNGSFSFYVEPIVAYNNDTHGIFVEIYHNNKFHSQDEEVCELFSITLDTYYKRLKNVFKNCFMIDDQIYYDKVERDKLIHLKTDISFNDGYFNDLKNKFKEVFCEELILLNLQ